METGKLCVGMSVKIVSDTSGHGHKVGSVLTVSRIVPSGFVPAGLNGTAICARDVEVNRPGDPPFKPNQAVIVKEQTNGHGYTLGERYYIANGWYCDVSGQWKFRLRRTLIDRGYDWWVAPNEIERYSKIGDLKAKAEAAQKELTAAMEEEEAMKKIGLESPCGYGERVVRVLSLVAKMKKKVLSPEGAEEIQRIILGS